MKKTIQELRKEKGLTQQQLANDLGVNLRTIGKWEHHEVNIPQRTHKLLSLYFHTKEENIDF